MNDVKLVGYVSSNPKFIEGENPRLEFLVCPTHKKDAAGDFIPCKVWGKYAESIRSFVDKGDLIAVNGRISSHYLPDNSLSPSVTARNVEFLRKKNPAAQEEAEAAAEEFTGDIDENEIYNALYEGGR